GQDARAAERAVTHRLPGLLRRQPLRPGDADRGHPPAQVASQLGLQEVRRRPRQHLLRPLLHPRNAARGVRMRVDQPAQQHPLPGVDEPRPRGARLLGGCHPPDHAILNQHRDALTHRAAGAVKQPQPGQTQPARSWRGRRDQRRKPVRHACSSRGQPAHRPAAPPLRTQARADAPTLARLRSSFFSLSGHGPNPATRAPSPPTPCQSAPGPDGVVIGAVGLPPSVWARFGWEDLEKRAERMAGMAVEIRRDKEIYATDGGWFAARWHFSFDHYHDPAQMGVGALRVFNDDRLQPGAVWPLHPHRDIESCTYVVEGLFAHDDSLGNNGTLEPGAAQAMRFSHRGALHSERNGSQTQGMRFLQFWILPSQEGLENSVQQRQYTQPERAGRLLQRRGPAGEAGLDLAQDARVVVAHLRNGDSVHYGLGADRGGYLYVLDGGVRLGNETLGGGDAAKLAGPEDLELTGTGTAELILIEGPLQFRPVGVCAR